ncbi:tyrosine-protein phosphatase non-receptor type 1-like isoform X2 [Varroa jacobsoni]|nr:tyrosine-protein phosphatase non-receptor type 1-like isoform X2 [Varroa jacobsoni]
MVWENNTKGIVMLNKLVENDAKKCHRYWPDANEKKIAFEGVDLRVSFVSESTKESYICRTFQLHDSKIDTTRDVLHFHYVNWPDFGVPRSPNDFLDFLEDVRYSGCLDANVGPAVVHCSAGIGRSGTFCVVDSILKMIEEGRAESDIKLQDVLIDMRRFRMSLIQTAEQLRFSYLAILEALRRRQGRSPYLSRRGVNDDAPPPPPHRVGIGNKSSNMPIMVVNSTAVSSSDDDEDDDINDKNSPVAELSGFQDSAVSSEMSSGDESSEDIPPPLPPRHIFAADSPISSEDSPARSEQQQSQQRLETSQTEETHKQISNNINLSKDFQQNNREASEKALQAKAALQTATPSSIQQTITEDLQSFEQEILSKETMQQPKPFKGGNAEKTADISQSSKKQDEYGDASGEEHRTCLRQRKRQRDQKIKDKVQAIKKGIADSEAAHQRRGLFEKLGIGFVVLMGTGILMYRIYNYWRS